MIVDADARRVKGGPRHITNARRARRECLPPRANVSVEIICAHRPIFVEGIFKSGADHNLAPDSEAHASRGAAEAISVIVSFRYSIRHPILEEDEQTVESISNTAADAAEALDPRAKGRRAERSFASSMIH